MRYRSFWRTLLSPKTSSELILRGTDAWCRRQQHFWGNFCSSRLARAKLAFEGICSFSHGIEIFIPLSKATLFYYLKKNKFKPSSFGTISKESIALKTTVLFRYHVFLLCLRDRAFGGGANCGFLFLTNQAFCPSCVGDFIPDFSGKDEALNRLRMKHWIDYQSTGRRKSMYGSNTHSNYLPHIL